MKFKKGIIQADENGHAAIHPAHNIKLFMKEYCIPKKAFYKAGLSRKEFRDFLKCRNFLTRSQYERIAKEVFGLESLKDYFVNLQENFLERLSLMTEDNVFEKQCFHNGEIILRDATKREKELFKNFSYCDFEEVFVVKGSNVIYPIYIDTNCQTVFIHVQGDTYTSDPFCVDYDYLASFIANRGKRIRPKF